MKSNLCASFFVVLILATLVSAQPAEQAKAEIPPPAHFTVSAAESEIRVDGVLDEEAWAKASAVIPVPYEWQPGDNSPSPVETKCMVTFNRDYLYIGIHAYDPDPSSIRAHLMDRDSTDSFIQDDHVGLMIDTFNDKRRAFQIRINPLGVQMDAIFSELEGIEDFSWDIIWDSRGRITSEGYDIEIAIPFNQIRFPRTTDAQTWGIEVFRSWPRNVRHRMSSRFTDRQKNCVLCQENTITGFQGMTRGRNVEFDPTLTADRTDSRPDYPNGPLEEEDSNVDPGLTARWGVTPNMTLGGAVNPDFSQVEADVAQLDVNTRFALFFPEKRPFFLEGVDIFATPLNTVFTRTVADPQWGIKLTGKEGANGIGVFATRDEINNLIIPSNQFSDLATIDQEVTGSVFRYRRDVGSRSTIGALYAGREGDGYHNRLAGFDGFLRFTDSDTLNVQLLHSDTLYPQGISSSYGQPAEAFGDQAYHIEYSHNSRNWNANAGYQDLDPGFRADSGFIPRVDIRKVWGRYNRIFWGDGNKWYTRINAGIYAENIEDHSGLLTDRQFLGYTNFSGPMQSLGEVAFEHKEEFFDGITYDLNRPSFYLEMKPTGSVSFTTLVELGDYIDYSGSRAADGYIVNPTMRLRLGKAINLEFNHTLQHLDVDQGKLFTANLSQVKIVYQFNVRTFVRAIFQYTDITRDPALYAFPVAPETRELFTQLLFSYKINPQTVIFVGYSDNYLGFERIDLTQTDRTFFLKLGYAWLF